MYVCCAGNLNVVVVSAMYELLLCFTECSIAVICICCFVVGEGAAFNSYVDFVAAVVGWAIWYSGLQCLLSPIYVVVGK